MPVIKFEDFGTENAPDWAKVTGGINGMGCSTRDKSASGDVHFHDAEEFWFVLNGKARVLVGGKEHIVERGDVVCAHMGDDHAILEVLEEPYTQVWIECNRRGQKRSGHLHRGTDDA
jgi:mannose-6-phosphate isomerase-like protein (cupin superfamily)